MWHTWLIYENQEGSKMPRGKQLTTEEFTKRAREVHGDKYDYSKTVYKTAKSKVVIVCPVHGEFTQIAGHHILDGSGCPKCGRVPVGNKLRNDSSDIIKKFVKIHGDTYDYSKVEYVNYKTPVKIVCPEHGVFLQSPSNHLKGQGCPECSKLISAAKRNKGPEFIERAKEIHGDKYDYSFVDYMTCEDKVEIICNTCGNHFTQTPSCHLSGHGCPKCAKNGFLSHNYGKLYLMVDNLEAPTLMKIGVSVNVEARKGRILRASKKAGAGIYDLYIVKTWGGSTENMLSVEKSVHEAFNKYKINFSKVFSGSTEFFHYRPEVFSIVEAVYKEICGK